VQEVQEGRHFLSGGHFFRACRARKNRFELIAARRE
jgi:hypothetical protein